MLEKYNAFEKLYPIKFGTMSKFLFRKETKAAEMKNTFSFQMAFKEAQISENGKIKIKGFASTPEIDRYDDIVNPSAFSGAMMQYMKNPVILLQHDSNKVLGQVLSYEITGLGLEVIAELSNDIENTFKNIIDKNLRGFSIGFICKAWNNRDDGSRQIREITDLDLVEISVVSTPANPSSLFSLSKSIKSFFADIDKKEAAEEPITPPTTTEEIPQVAAEVTPEVVPPTEDPKIEKEAPEGEIPPTSETMDVPASDISEPVEAGENTEVEALKTEVETLKTALSDEQAKSAQISKALEESQAEKVALDAKFVSLEKEFRSIEVLPGSKMAKKTEVKRVLTDADILRNMPRA